MVAIAEDLLLRIGAVDSASAVFGQVRSAVTEGLGAITGSAKATETGMVGVATASNTARIALIATGVGAAVAVVAGLVSMASKAQKLGEEMFEMSQRTGASTESLSTLRFAAEQSGLTMEQLEGGMTKLARTAGSAIQEPLGEQARLFTALGVSVTDAEGKMRPTDQLMLDISDKLRGIQSPGERAAVAMELFGRSGTQLLPMLLEGSTGIKAMQDRARELGMEMSGDSAAAADQLGDKMDELSSMVGAVATRIGTALLPNVITSVTWLIKLGETAIDAGRILGEVGAIAFEPIRLGWSLVAGGVRLGIFNLVNYLGERITAGVNVAIGAFNTLGTHIGVTIDTIDWAPLTEEPAVDFAAEWEASKTRVTGHWDRIKTLSSGMATRLTADTAAVGTSAGGAADQVEELNFKMSDLSKETQDARPDLVAMRAELTAFDASAYLAETQAGTLKDEIDALAKETEGLGIATQEIDWDSVAPPPAWGTEFSSSFATKFRDGLKTDTSSRAIGDGLGTGLTDGLDQVLSGGGFAQAASAVGTAIGTAMGGPIGGLIGSAIGGATKLIGNLFGGTSRSESRRNVVEEIQQSVSQGSITNFAAFNNLERSLADAGSAKLTLDAIMSTFDLDAEQAASLLRLLTNRDTLTSGANASYVAQFNELLGANAQAGNAAIAAGLVRAQSGYDGMVTRPTLFMAGEAGPEHVRVNPSPFSDPGFQGSAGPTIQITNYIQAWDRIGLEQFVDNELLPQVQRGLQRLGRRGAYVTDQTGIRSVETA